MVDRRKRERFTLASPYDVCVRMFEELVIEYMDASSVVGVVTQAAICGEVVELEIDAGSGRRTVVFMEVRETRPVIFNGRLRQRLIGVHADTDGSQGAESRGQDEHWWHWDVATAAVARQMAARVVNLSSGGCLLETARALAIGVVARVIGDDVDGGGGDVVRVCGCEPRPGAALPFQLMCELLMMKAAAPNSIRDRAVRLEAKAHRPWLGGAGEISGPDQTTADESDPVLAAAGDGVSEEECSCSRRHASSGLGQMSIESGNALAQ